MCFVNATCQETLYMKTGISAFSPGPGCYVLALKVYSAIASYGATQRLCVTVFAPLRGIWHVIRRAAKWSTMLIKCHAGPVYILRRVKAKAHSPVQKWSTSMQEHSALIMGYRHWAGRGLRAQQARSPEAVLGSAQCGCFELEQRPC